MAEVDFYKLERPVQDRFADATRAIGVPVPLLRVPPVERRHWGWFAGAAGAVIAVALLTVAGFGDSTSSWAIAPAWHLAVSTTLIGVATFCVLRGIAIKTALTTRPYRPGLYLFPVGVVDARREPLRVHKLAEITKVEADSARRLVTVNLADGSRHVFPSADDGEPDRVVAAVEEARGLHDKALRSQNRREQALLDPLVDSGFSSPFSPKLPLMRRVPPWQTLTPVIALLAGVGLSFGTWTVRNRLSERVLYAKATEADSVEAYEQYLERGGSRSEVRDILLPRAELREARAVGSVEAIEKYAKEHPDSKIASEINAALQHELDRELEAAKATNTVSALRAFAEKRKGYAYIREPVRAAIHDRYEHFVEKFKSEADPSERVASFMEALIAYSRDHSPKVVVRWLRAHPESLKNVDSQIKLSAYFMGARSIPSQYFGPEYAAKREKAATEVILARFREVFPAEILDFELGQPVDDAGDELPKATVPTLFVKVTPNLAGGYMSTKPRNVFVGVGLTLESAFVIPGRDESLKVKASSWRTPSVAVYREDGATVADVYDDMAGTGYERFAETFLKTVFRNDKS